MPNVIEEEEPGSVEVGGDLRRTPSDLERNQSSSVDSLEQMKVWCFTYITKDLGL